MFSLFEKLNWLKLAFLTGNVKILNIDLFSISCEMIIANHIKINVITLNNSFYVHAVNTTAGKAVWVFISGGL